VIILVDDNGNARPTDVLVLDETIGFKDMGQGIMLIGADVTEGAERTITQTRESTIPAYGATVVFTIDRNKEVSKDMVVTKDVYGDIVYREQTFCDYVYKYVTEESTVTRWNVTNVVTKACVTKECVCTDNGEGGVKCKEEVA